jgi:hypothetical protein
LGGWVLVVQFRLVERVTYERVFTAANLRAQQYFQVLANRLGAELDLYEYENAEKREQAAPVATSVCQHNGPRMNQGTQIGNLFHDPTKGIPGVPHRMLLFLYAEVLGHFF